jgi:putative ABC transport system ATP-binding protein
VALGSLLVTVHQVCEVAVPVAVGVIIDRAVSTGDGGAIVRWIAGLAALFAVLSFAGCYGLYVHERTTMGAAHGVRLRVARRVLDPGGGVEDALPGQVVSLSTVETARIGEGVAAVIVGVGAVAGVLAGAVVLLVTSWTLGLVVVLGLPVALFAVQTLSQPLVARADAQQEAVGVAAGVAADLFAGLRVLKGLGAEAAAAARYRRSSGSALGAALAANRVRSTYFGITMTVAGGFLVLVTWIGARQALDGTITVGELVAALGITQFLVGPLGRLAYFSSVLAQGRASSAHVGEALEAPPAVHGGTERLPATSSIAGEVALRDLRHGPLLGVSLSVGAGELVGVVATEPADAAALVACLDRSVEPDGGSVTVDGVALSALTLDDARRAVVVAHHDARLFEGSLADNVSVAAGPTGETDDRSPVEAAIEAAGADAVVDDLAEGLDAPLAEGGRSLSGGQRQRVALARALATDAPVLVLHEPTTAVDAATEHRIAAGLRSLRAGRRTTIVITSSPTLLAVADRVAVVDGGRVVADGDHAGLAATHDRYRTAVLT